jgi:hypothetical protein
VTTARYVRRLRHGPVSVELDYNASHAIMMCRVHKAVADIPLDSDANLGQLLVEFFQDHEACAHGATFELDEPLVTALRPTALA